MIPAIGGTVFVMCFVLWMMFVQSFLTTKYYHSVLHKLDALTSIESQQRQDSWQEVAPKVEMYLKQTKGKFSVGQVNRDHKALNDAVAEASKDARSALQELQKLKSRLYKKTEPLWVALLKFRNDQRLNGDMVHKGYYLH